MSPVRDINIACINSHLSPEDIENALFAGHLSCALLEEMEKLEKEEAGCGRPFPWNSYQPHPLSGGLGMPVGAPPPASGSSDVLGPRRPIMTTTARV